MSIKRLGKVQVWVVLEGMRERRVLLLKTTPSRGGFWQPVTGGVDEGESSQDAAIRELREETGLSSEFAVDFFQLDYSFSYFKGEVCFDESCWCAVFALENGLSNLPQIQIDQKEHSEFGWVDVQEAGRRIQYESNRIALGRALASLDVARMP